ncbi:hypothetical protein [Actinomadura sp. WAC 06369]|uniref:hypothetical protein n=1 Tax=Actinomadura sp. WAC 06369 TaxID=2203193 RepID=UPI000F765FD1|nr:hypothetical protein [Actinomadura sp. WAC 06369]RSN51123.1 hypothetical protein DMH08_31345 [Actinomadura sp. WAC 06369]
MTGDEKYLGDIARPRTAGPGESSGGDIGAAVAILASEQGETRAHLQELRDQLGDVLQDLHKLDQRTGDIPALESKIAALADALDKLVRSDDDDSDTRPRDLAHIAPEDREQVLGDLVAWVRDVLFVGWPWAAASLAPCWLEHPDIVNGVLWLRAAYAAAYDTAGARPHAAADWHRWLDDVMATAERRTEGCPEDGSHAVPPAPRDDSERLRAVVRRDAFVKLHRFREYLRPGAPYPPDVVQAAREEWDKAAAAVGLTEDAYNLLAELHRLAPYTQNGAPYPPEDITAARARYSEITRSGAVTQEDYRTFVAALARVRPGT